MIEDYQKSSVFNGAMIDPKHTVHMKRKWILCDTPHVTETLSQSQDLNVIDHLRTRCGRKY